VFFDIGRDLVCSERAVDWYKNFHSRFCLYPKIH